MSSLLWVDLETSGFSSNSAVLELAAIPIINGERHPHFHSYIRPHEGAAISADALMVNKIDPKEMLTFPTAEKVLEDFIKFIDGYETVFTIAGHKVAFDRKHLYTLFNRTANYSNFIPRFSPSSICTLELAKEVFGTLGNGPKNFNLEDLCKHFNIELKNAHSALPDIEATISVYDRLCALKEAKESRSVPLTYQQQRAKYLAIDYLTINPEGDCYIHRKAMKDPEAMRFILNELWRVTQ